ncbi:MAG: histone family protein DNA-binding protein [Desulfomicrobiaceae bacterium]|jgi:integration host factor subunit beta|nr:integration host factor subunit beta [Desulfomicrobiaceae bacterium]MBZ4647877.1 histone family protein DNA-binding protein [Desulfomicrobiaceae bacterium]MBZ4684781.1 histone family protein DNA-binding protein [Desulfomicrobiaceae bacterium]MDI3492888.1 integration host factor subunit beta [Desulfomicrobiaceae bacterium]MDK2872426.1 integration host factor subunit beta [Desulfomicrobiaceae bacterium]
MNKSDLIQALAERAGITHDEATMTVETFFEAVRDAMLRGDRVELRGFGSFKIKHYDGYTGRNPKTGEPVEVRPKRLPFFKAGKGLVDAVNDR